jgi:hypothetical protein
MSYRFLKVKIKNLGDEIKDIKLEEFKSKKSYRRLKARQGFEEAHQKEVSLFWKFRGKREECSLEARDSHLAYAFLRGQTYRTVENNGNPVHKWYWSYDKKQHIPIYSIDLSNIASMVNRFGDLHGDDRVDELVIERWILAEENAIVAAE